MDKRQAEERDRDMHAHSTPDLPDELLRRITLVRRDIGSLLFHFTRKPDEASVHVGLGQVQITMSPSAGAVLRKILYEGRLGGTSRWSHGQECVCFTEAPIQEFHSIFALVEIAASEKERPRYEPYGIGVSKKWLFAQGGRPVVYDHPAGFDCLPEDHKFRFVPYDPGNNVDFTWEREWRIRTDYLQLDPRETLIVVPTSEEAFELVYEFADIEPDGDQDGFPSGSYHKPRWLAVSLDVFGFRQ